MPVLEVACDESGSEGENLIGGETDVFAHAGVNISLEAARSSVQEIRDRIGSPAEEYKANHLLREKNRPVLEWLLAPAGPIHGIGQVHLTDKTFFAVSRAVGLLAGDDEQGGRARALYREGPGTFGRTRWEFFLASFISLMRLKTRRGVTTSIGSFFDLIESLAAARGPAAEVMGLLRRGRAELDGFRAKLAVDPGVVPVLDPLMPAIACTVEHWSDGGTAVSLIHDEQLALTGERIVALKEMLGHRLADLRLVDSRSDPRVQIADFLAGVARRIASEELNARGDAELGALLRPFVDGRSIWGDDRSWALLGPVQIR